MAQQRRLGLRETWRGLSRGQKRAWKVLGALVVGLMALRALTGGTSEPSANDRAQHAFDDWFSSTVCAAGTASDPEPNWCSHFRGVSFSGHTLTARTSLTSPGPDASDMCFALTVFIGSKLRSDLGLNRSEVYSEAGGNNLCK